MKPLLISSAQNDHFKALKQLSDMKGIKKQKKFILSGEKVIAEMLTTRLENVHHVILVDGDSDNRRRYADLGVALMILDKPLFEELDMFGTRSPLLVCDLPELSPWSQTSAPQGFELLLSQGDPANLGAAIRTAVAFGAEKLVLLKEAASPFHPKALRASSGAWIHAHLCKGPSIHDLVADPSLVVLDLQGEAIQEFRWPLNTRLLVGEEGPGVAPAIPGHRVWIPIGHKVESLNATVATSLAVFSYRSQHSLKPHSR